MHSVRVYDITHTFNGPLSGTARVSRYQKGKTNLDFTKARYSVWQWHQLGHMQSAPCSRQITVPAHFFTTNSVKAQHHFSRIRTDATE